MIIQSRRLILFPVREFFAAEPTQTRLAQIPILVQTHNKGPIAERTISRRGPFRDLFGVGDDEFQSDVHYPLIRMELGKFY